MQATRCLSSLFARSCPLGEREIGERAPLCDSGDVSQLLTVNVKVGNIEACICQRRHAQNVILSTAAIRVIVNDVLVP